MPLTPTQYHALTLEAARQHVEEMRKADPLSGLADKYEQAITITESRLADMERVA